MTTEAPTMIGQSPALLHILRTLPMIAASDVSVLISGETGTGKELVAQTLHAHSNRRDQALVTINCATLSADAVEADLFGRCDESGDIVAQGRILAAHNGTVFFDNVEALPLSVQAKVLRFLEAGECQLQGSHKLHMADVRILAASSANLVEEVAAGHFRADLFYRLNVVPVELPALRERREDIPALLKHYCNVYAGNHAPPRLSKETVQCLQNYVWPGNVRELANLCQRLALLHPGKLLAISDLPEDMQPETQRQQMLFKLPAHGVDLAQVELSLIEQALEKTAGNRSKAARLLGISRDTLLYRMQKYGLSV